MVTLQFSFYNAQSVPFVKAPTLQKPYFVIQSTTDSYQALYQVLFNASRQKGRPSPEANRKSLTRLCHTE